MDLTLATLIYFSPTKTTKKVLEGIAQGIQINTAKHLDLTPPEAKMRNFEELHEEITVIGAPVHRGRIPIQAAERLKRIKAHNTPAVVVVAYGNREYDDALLELKNLVMEAGFIPVAGGAFIGEHSFSKETTPIATGRPDREDLQKARAFGAMIQKKLRDIHTLDEVPSLQVPGNFPYKEMVSRSGESPVTQEPLCIKCETCVTVCPAAAITVKETVMTDSVACITCCACVKSCPTGARIMEHPRIKEMAERLYKNCGDRKEPEMYL